MTKRKKRPGTTPRERQLAPAWATGLRARDSSSRREEAAVNKALTLELEPDTSRPSANFDDPILRQHAWRIDHVGISAFLVALAAWQRGLHVIFHYELASKTERFANLDVQGFRGELFSVSDGRRIHYFRRTLGDLTTKENSALTENKQATKERLRQHGIDVPDGIVVSRDDTATLDGFLARHPGKQFLIKPLDGTQGKGVISRIAADQVLGHLEASQGETLLLEEMVKGHEYRVYVTGERYISAYKKRPASVEGDGRSTIRQLAQEKTRLRQRGHPLNAVAVPLGETEASFLEQQGWTFDTVPGAGERIYLNDFPLPYDGADQVESTESLPAYVREASIRAAQALGLPNTGLDVIVIPETQRYVILEANQCPILVFNVFPTLPTQAGNRVAESIIDHYFPGSVDNTRHTRASFDFAQICQALRSGTLGEIALPVLGSDWVHRRFSIPATQLDERAEPTIRGAMFTIGIHAQLIKSNVGDLIVDIVAPEDRLERFTAALRESR